MLVGTVPSVETFKTINPLIPQNFTAGYIFVTFVFLLLTTMVISYANEQLNICRASERNYPQIATIDQLQTQIC